MVFSVANCVFAFISLLVAIVYSGQSGSFIQKLNELLHWKTGCNPIPSVGNVSLHYFDTRERAEAIRMLMIDQNIPFTESIYTQDTWPDAKMIGVSAGLFTFGQVPAIVTSKRQYLCQSKVIIQFLGRSVGLDCDCADLSRCDLIAAGVDDLYQRRSAVLHQNEVSYRMLTGYLKDYLFPWFGYFERLAAHRTAESEGFFFASDRLTWVDYLVFDMVESNCDLLNLTEMPARTETNVDYDDGEYFIGKCEQFLSRYPRLLRFYNGFRTRVNLAPYLEGSRQPRPYPIPLKPKK